MKIKKTWGDMISALKMMWNLDRILFLTCVGSALIDSLLPYIEIYLSAYVLDGLGIGVPYYSFMQTVCLVLISVLLLRILKSEKIKHNKN